MGSAIVARDTLCPLVRPCYGEYTFRVEYVPGTLNSQTIGNATGSDPALLLPNSLSLHAEDMISCKPEVALDSVFFSHGRLHLHPSPFSQWMEAMDFNPGTRASSPNK